MKKGMVLLVAGLLAATSFPALTQARAVLDQRHQISLNPLDRMKVNGKYVVDTFKDGKWQEAGALSFNRFFKEKKLDLNPYLPEGGKTVKIRLRQEGGAAAHIDTVLLGGKPPTEAKDTTDLKKVSGKDYDVIDAFEKGLEFSFPADGKDMTLGLTARVEGEGISETPFQFPLKNLCNYKEMDEGAEFYTYRLNTEKGDLRKKDVEEPLFKEHSLTGSGHPSGYTYGWVSNDEEHLYAKIDFTPDNTMDGDKDYAKLYVKTEAGLKEFKVSVPETKWGKPDFTYTDKAAYQHKVYDFKIPLSELGIKDAKKERELRLAFAAYGTARPLAAGDVLCNPSIAFNPQNNRHLNVYSKIMVDNLGPYIQVYGQIVHPNGIPLGAEFLISHPLSFFAVYPSVAYDSASDRFLVVWVDTLDGITTDIFGRLLNGNGTPAGQDFMITPYLGPGAEWFPQVAADTSFFVVWEDWQNGGEIESDVYGQRVNTNGSLNGPQIPIANAPSYQWLPQLAYDSAKDRFLVVWWDYRAGSNDIYGQLVKANGALKGNNFVVSNAVMGQAYPSIAYDSKKKRYFVVWSDFRNNTDWNVYGQLVKPDGGLKGDARCISDAPGDAMEPIVAFGGKRYLTAWTDYRNGKGDIYGQHLKPNGKPFLTQPDTNFPIFKGPGGQGCVDLDSDVDNEDYLGTFITEGIGMNGVRTQEPLYALGECDCDFDADGFDDLGNFQVCITGAVGEAGTGNPLPDRLVLLKKYKDDGTKKVVGRAYTGNNGCFKFNNVPSGIFKVLMRGQCSAIGGKGRSHGPFEVNRSSLTVIYTPFSCQ